MEERFSFDVESYSDPETVYQVCFKRSDQSMSITCTCKAGQMGQFCKHRMDLLNDRTDHLLNDSEDDLRALSYCISWIEGSSLHDAFKHLDLIEDKKLALQKEERNVKRQVGRLMESFA